MKINKINIILLCILISNWAFSQSNFQSKLSVSVDKTNVNSLLLASHKVLESKPALAFEYIELALDLSIQKKNKNLEGQCYFALAELNFKLEIYNTAINNYKKSEKLFKSINSNSALLNCYEALAKAYEKENNHNKSQQYSNKYLELSRKMNSKKNIIKANKLRAFSNALMKNYDASIEDYKKVKKEELIQNNVSGIIDANNKIGEILIEQSNEDKAIEYFQEAQNIAIKEKDEKSIAKSYSNIGDAYRSQKKYDKELEARQKSANINTKTENIEALTNDNLNIAKVYMEINNPQKAIDYYKKSLKYFEKVGNIKKQSEIYKSLSKALIKTGNNSKAMTNYKAYVTLKDSLLDLKEKEIMAKLEINTLVLEKQQRINLLEKNKALKENEILILRQEKKIRAESIRSQRNLIYGLIAFVLLMLASSLLILRSSQQKRIANQMLALKSLRSQMNPHFIFNALNSVNSFISTSNERAANKYLSEFSRLMRSVLDNSEHNFIPLSTEINMLKLYLNLEHLRFKEKFDYSFNISPNIDADQLKIPPMLVQPYIENSIWHGLRYKKEKGFLKVMITENNSYVKITIEDNGIGRKASQELKTANQKSKTSTGIKNIKTRLELLNKTYKTNIQATITDVEMDEKTGTLVEIYIPNKIG